MNYLKLPNLIFLISYSRALFLSSIYIKYLKRKSIEIIDRAVPKDECSTHLKVWIGDLFNLKKMWALKMLDASAKAQTGILSGNIIHFGDYDQCLDVKELRENSTIIEGQYCNVGLLPAKNSTDDLGQILDLSTSISEIMGIKEGKDMKHILKLIKVVFGICLPKSCKAENIQKLWNYIEFTFRLPVHVTVSDDFCTYKGKVPFKYAIDEIVLCCFGLYFAFIICATIYEIIVIKNKTGNFFYEKLIMSFSLCVNGLKVLSMAWVIFGHVYGIGFLSGTTNMLDYFEWKKSFAALLVLMAPFSVDTFLVISGLLLAYKYMEIRDWIGTEKRFPYFTFYFMRFLRLWPCLLATILLFASILKYLNNGPIWAIATYKTAFVCMKTGWITALFATNFISFQHQCIEPTWYLSVDSQLYFIAPLFLYFIYKSSRKASVCLIGLSTLSMMYGYYMTITRNEQWNLSEGDDSYHFHIYQSTFVRSPPWIFGLLAGTFLYKLQKKRISKFIVSLMWISIVSIFLLVVFAHKHLFSVPYNAHYAGLFNSTARSLWGLAICFVIVLCETGNGGFVNDVLSLDIYTPLVRISYSVYLLHLAVIMVLFGGKRQSTYHDSFKSFQDFLSLVPFVLVASFLWCLAFESPFINIAKLLIKLDPIWSSYFANSSKEQKLQIMEYRREDSFGNKSNRFITYYLRKLK